MKKVVLVLGFFSVIAAFSCAGQPEKKDGGGVVVIKNIPEKYLDGIILVTGKNANGSTFTYSTKTLQQITGTTMKVKIYSSVSAEQTAFSGSGVYSVTITLYTKGSHENSETAVFDKKFTNGYCEIDFSGIRYK
ncbi:MAG: hypothetical protein Ta2B_24220 [Termitinemataceae bacterium]|nr:MAG: hypothetical protein Ta2B_24220 [Termitinemataceae bacterium]